MKIENSMSPVLSLTSQSDRVVGNNQVTNTSNRSGGPSPQAMGTDAGKQASAPAGVFKPAVEDVAKASGNMGAGKAGDLDKSIGDILKAMFESILKDGNVDKGEAESVMQLAKLLSALQTPGSGDVASGVKDAGRQPEAGAPAVGGSAGSQAPPNGMGESSEADEKAALGIEKEDDAASALGLSEDEAQEAAGDGDNPVAGGQESFGLQAGQGQGQAPGRDVGRQEGGAKGGNAGAREAYDAMKQVAMRDGNVSPNEKAALKDFGAKNNFKDEAMSTQAGPKNGNTDLALLATLKSSLKDGAISDDEFKLISKMVDKGAGKNFSEAQKTALLSKFFDVSNKDNNFSDQDLKTFKLLSQTPSRDSAEVSNSRESSRGSSSREPSRGSGSVGRQDSASSLPPPPKNAGTADFLRSRLDQYIYPQNKKSVS